MAVGANIAAWAALEILTHPGVAAAAIEAGLGEGGVVGLGAVGGVAAARGVGSKLYHYTPAGDAGSIAAEGLLPGPRSGKIWTTIEGGLGPLQAQIDLPLPPNRGLPDAVFEI